MTITSTMTITPKAITKTHYSYITVTSTITCCHFVYNNQPAESRPRLHGGSHHRREWDDLEIRQDNDTEHVSSPSGPSNLKGLEKRANDPCDALAYSRRPTATIYTNTVFITDTVTFTDTETDTSSITNTVYETAPTATVTTSSMSIASLRD